MTIHPQWTSHTYTIPASHPRGYRRGTRCPSTSRLQLSVKHYTPITPPAPSSNAITLILHHGMPPAAFKESFEPFLSDLLRQHPSLPPIRAIWTWDDVCFGASYKLNKRNLGDTHHWHDSARDLLQICNQFSTAMIPPIIGLGQSWGAVAMVMAACWSPALFAGLVLSEPLLENARLLYDEQRARGATEAQVRAAHPGRAMAARRTNWPSVQEARASFGRSRMFELYDPRVRELIFKYEFIVGEGGKVRLVPPNAQVVPFFVRALPALDGCVPERDEHAIEEEWLTMPGLGITQGESTRLGLRGVRCHTLILWSTESNISTEAYKKRILENLGTGAGGGGGKEKGQVDEMVVTGEHSLPYFQPAATADAVARWLRTLFWPRWSREMELIEKEPPIASEKLTDEFLALLQIPSKL